MTTATQKPPSATTAASIAFVASHLAEATALGERMGQQVGDADAVVATLSAGFAALGDPVYADGNRRVAPGLGPTFGVRLALMSATQRAFKRATRKTSPGPVLDVAERLLRQEPRELRWFAIGTLSRTLPGDPDRSWQLLRATAATADEWITVDTLAHPYCEGILQDPRRWPELEQFMYSDSRWERRLVGSTLATMIHASSHGGRKPETVTHGLQLIGQLIGDNEPDVQKALSWALRDFTAVSPAAVAAFAAEEAATAARTADGHRAWVVRDMLVKLPPAQATRIRQILEGVRRAPGAASTSKASATAAAFRGGLTPPKATPVPAARAAAKTPED